MPLAVGKKRRAPWMRGARTNLFFKCCPLPLQVLPVDFQEELLKFVAPENLMVRYGGTNATPLIDSPGPWKDAKVSILCSRMRRMHMPLPPPGMPGPGL